MSSITQARPGVVAVHVVENAVGGVAQFVKLLAEAQANDPAFADVHLIADKEKMGGLASCRGCLFHYYSSSRSLREFAATARAVLKHLDVIQPDIVYLHSSFPGAYVRLLRRRYAWKVVYCAHGYSFDQERGALKRIAYSRVERLLAGRSDAIVNVSFFEEQTALRARVLARNNVTIKYGMPEPSYDSSVSFEPDRDRLNLAYIGRLDYKKGSDRLLEAFDCDQLAGINLWLLGASSGSQNFKIPARDNVRMLGWIPNEQIDSYIRKFDAVIVPSRHEAMGLVGLEAMRNACPAIVSRVGGLQEVVQEGVNGCYIDISDIDGMRRTLLELTPQTIKKYSSNARRIFEEQFTWVECYRKWSALTQALLENLPVASVR